MTREYMVRVMKSVIEAARDPRAVSWQITKDALAVVERFDLPWPDDVAALFGDCDDSWLGPIVLVKSDKGLALAYECLLPNQNEPHRSSEPRSRKKPRGR